MGDPFWPDRNGTRQSHMDCPIVYSISSGSKWTTSHAELLFARRNCVPGGSSTNGASDGSFAKTSFNAHTCAVSISSSRPHIQTNCHPVSTGSSDLDLSANKIG